MHSGILKEITNGEYAKDNSIDRKLYTIDKEFTTRFSLLK